MSEQRGHDRTFRVTPHTRNPGLPTEEAPTLSSCIDEGTAMGSLNVSAGERTRRIFLQSASRSRPLVSSPNRAVAPARRFANGRADRKSGGYP